MKNIVGFEALNLDLIFKVDDFKSISIKGSRLDPGKESFGSDEGFQSLLEQLKQFGTLKSTLRLLRSKDQSLLRVDPERSFISHPKGWGLAPPNGSKKWRRLGLSNDEGE